MNRLHVVLNGFHFPGATRNEKYRRVQTKGTHTLIVKSRAWSSRCCGLAFQCCCTVKWSEILPHIKLLYNPRVNKVFTLLHFNVSFLQNLLFTETFHFTDRKTSESTYLHYKWSCVHSARPRKLGSASVLEPVKLTSDIKQRNKEVNIIDPNPNNSYITKKKFTDSYTELSPKIASERYNLK